ncbi:hypothetical protein GGI07_004301 [Coemansia sp. Benny D115]|nr:hypothetical protein GGI07_004301 [Coemansia sp. Benny D115]
MRRFIIAVVIFLLVLQILASLVETGIYAGAKIVLDKNDLAYTKGWQYYFKWVVKPLSAGLALALGFFGLCSCLRRNADPHSGRPRRTFMTVLTIISTIMSVLWAIVVAYQVRDNDDTTVNAIINDSVANRGFVYPLGKGFSLKNKCDEAPFTLLDHGSTACKLLKAESGLAIGCLGLWGLTLIMSFFLCCSVRRAARGKRVSNIEAYSPTTTQFKY